MTNLGHIQIKIAFVIEIKIGMIEINKMTLDHCVAGKL
jgi:hypothetical protein